MPSVGPREQICPGNCCLGPHDIAFYCGCRPLCECFLSKVGLPLLATPCCGKMCLINMLGKPCYGCCDMLCMKDSKNPDRPSGLNAIKAVVVLTIRPVKDMAAYKAAYDKYAKEVQGSAEGIRSMFSFPDKDREGFVLQVGWYDSPEVLAGVPTDADVEACYTENEKSFGAVYGNRSEVTQKALAATGVKYEYGSLPRGFMKSAPHPGFDSSLYPGPPMIWMSKRWVQPGRNPAIAKAFAKVGDLQYYTAPAFLSGFEYTADDNPDQLWSLRFFNDYDMGHVAHFPKTLCSYVPTRVLLTMIPELKGGLGAEFPVGLSFSTKEDIVKAIAYNGGNAAYTQYFWEDVIGPLPDMGKGVPALAGGSTAKVAIGGPDNEAMLR